MVETADLRVISQIGQGYVGICDQFLTEQLGRPYTLPELSQFAETAVATLLASAYANFREAMGKEAAEAWLKKTLAVGASTVRLLGADALLRFEVHIKDMPNKLHQRRQELKQELQAETQPVKCECVLAPDGSCPSCIPTLSGIFKGTFEFMRHMAESGKKSQGVCQACRASQTDRALVSIIPDAIAINVPPEQKEGFHQEILMLFHQIAGAHGATAIPLTEQAWKEVAK